MNYTVLCFGILCPMPYVYKELAGKVRSKIGAFIKYLKQRIKGTKNEQHRYPCTKSW